MIALAWSFRDEYNILDLIYEKQMNRIFIKEIRKFITKTYNSTVQQHELVKLGLSKIIIIRVTTQLVFIYLVYNVAVISEWHVHVLQDDISAQLLRIDYITLYNIIINLLITRLLEKNYLNIDIRILISRRKERKIFSKL